MNKKAQELTLSPAVVTIFALGVVGLTLLNAIAELGTTKDYDEKVYATRNALIRDALQAVPKDTSVQTEITIPKGLGLEIEQHKARAAYGIEGYTFYYTKNFDYTLLNADFDQKKNNSPLIHYKTGNTIGTESKALKPGFTPNMIIPYCPPKTKQMKIQHEKQEINNYGKTPIKMTSGDLTIYAKETTGEPIVKIYTNSEDGQQIACYIIQNLAEKFPIKGGAPILVNTKLTPSKDDRNVENNEMLIELGLPLTAPAEKAKFATAVYEGVRKYAE